MAVSRSAVEPLPAFGTTFSQAQEVLPGPDLRPWRRASYERFVEQGIPTVRAEDWKYTNIVKTTNVPLAMAPRIGVGLDAISPYLLGGHKARRLIFVNGHIVPELSHARSLPRGVRVKSLPKALQQEPDRVAQTLAIVEDDRSFTALNGAFAGAGAWIELDDGADAEDPLQLLFLTVGQASAFMSHPRIVVRLGAGARLRLIENHVGIGSGASLTNLVSQLDLGPGALLEHDRVELVTAECTQIGKAYVRLEDGARLAQTAATVGGGLVRNETEARILGRRVECVLSGLYHAQGGEHVDNLIRVHHMAPESHSDQFYKGVIDGRAHAVFAGKIIVHQDAQRTNAYQKNDNLLLSDDAEIDTKPELEIYADDVKCSHGATSGDLDPTALFYLRSRGLSREVAESVLTFAFAAEVVDRFADPTVRHHVREIAAKRLPGGPSLEELV
ncbi:MAG: Fe-S cluster assembly protein SufD [Geminicoccaceae bacterium]